MDGVIDMEQARAIVGNAAVWPRVRDFLWDFAGQVHPSWLVGLENLEALARLEQQIDLLHLDSPRVKRFILAQLEVAPCFHAFPKDDGSRLLLLNGVTLEDIVRWLGAIVCVEDLRRVTDGATVKALKAALPGVYPEVFGYVAYFSSLGFQRSDAAARSVEEAIVLAGHEFLATALSGLPASLVSRLKFKLPKDSPFAALASRIMSGAEGGREALDARREKARSHIFKLLKLKFPEAYSLCCS